MVGTPQASVAVATPGPGTPVGLQPKFEPGGQKVNTGGVVSTTLNVCVQELGHPSLIILSVNV